MKDAVIFDMDGVLIDSERAYFERRMAFFRQAGIVPGSSSLEDYVGASNKEVWQKLMPNCTDNLDQIEAQYIQYRENHPIDYRQALQPDLIAALQYLRDMDFAIALASAGERKDIEKMLRDCELTSFFDIVLSGEELDANKPDPLIYRLALEKLGVHPRETLVMEDSPIGITAAKAAGIETWALKPVGYCLDQTQADKIISGYIEFICEIRYLCGEER